MQNIYDYTRIKVCGLTRRVDVEAAVEFGVDALGFILYKKSPRYITLAQLKDLCHHLPPFIVPVLLFVNAQAEWVKSALAIVPNALLQFHGDETPDYCNSFQRPYLKAIRMHSKVKLLQCISDFSPAGHLLLDTYNHHTYGGSGETFDWSLIPTNINHRFVLSGGLNPKNVAHAIQQVKPWAVDVSSGVEVGPQAKGIKEHTKLQAFVKGVRFCRKIF
jgi:phosphoribosylanthranilate isomerase